MTISKSRPAVTVKNDHPEKLRPFISLGLSFTVNGDEASADCPFCGREDKLNVSVKTGMFRCVVCNTGTQKGGGNIYTFMKLVHKQSMEQTTGKEYETLRSQRKLLYANTLKAWGVAKSCISGEWLVPGYSEKGALTQLYRYAKLKDGYKLLAVAGLTHALHGPDLPTPVGGNQPTKEPKTGPVYRCFSADTEVLTPDGWVLFSALKEDTKVAAYNKYTEEICFEVPQARQELDHVGSMIYFDARWSELLVTPDHRVLCRGGTPRSRVKVKAAANVRQQMKLPVAGVCYDESTSPTPAQARLLAAFVADGCIRRGFHLEFRVGKQRKKDRLKELLLSARVPFKVDVFPGSEEYESIIVDRRHDESAFFLNFCPDKTWTGRETTWTLEARRAMLNELAFWDGDSGVENIRYFTSKEYEADVVSRVAVLSGYSSQVETKPQEGRATEYVVNLLPKTWRSMSKKPSKQWYSGKVYCVTTSTGFVVVRRHGKAMVSGNCEGPWDGMAVWEVMQQCRRGDAGTLIPTTNKELSLGGQGTVIAVPGCGTFNATWCTVMGGRPDYSMYDNDHPREFPVGSGKTTCAGLDGSRRAVEILAIADEVPTQCLYLRWGKDSYHDENLPSGYDVRDALSAAGNTLSDRVKALDELLAKMVPIPQEWIPGKGVGRSGGTISTDERPCESWAKLLAAAEQAQEFHSGMKRALAVCLASIVSVPTRGDQLWVKMMSPPSSGKSVICEALTLNRQYCVAKSTIRGFHSGFQTDKEASEDHSLINLVRDKTLITKDGDTLLTSPNRDQILAEARDVYDRTARTGYRNKQKRDYAGINMTWILAGTSSLRLLDTSELGERFVTVIIVDRMDDTMERRIAMRVAHRAMRDVGMLAGQDASSSDGPEMLEFKQLTAGYITYLRQNAVRLISAVVVPPPVIETFVDLATFVAFLRTRQSTKQDEKTERELNFRLTSQFCRLAMCLAVVLNKKTIDAEVVEMVKQCAMDTARGKTMDICDIIYGAGKKGEDPHGIAIQTGLSKEKVGDNLLFLRKIRAVVARRLNTGPVQGPIRYFLAPRLSQLYQKIVGLPPADGE